MKKLILLLLLLPLLSMQAREWGKTPRLTAVGNHLEDPEGNQVMLHGVMDTPSPYFSGYRFTDYQWIDVYKSGDNYIDKCKNYFDKLFTAVTDTAQGSWCNVFRLHLDPCWTDDPNVSASGFTEKNGKVYDPHGTEVSGEGNIQHFSKSRLTKYLDKLYLPLAKLAKGHGMYVIMRPPGVCPQNIWVDDYYQQYLIDVWDEVTRNSTVLENSDWLSIELANEPINVLDRNGKSSNAALHDFFQPIVEKIRANGFKGIIWVPGSSWQQNYAPYMEYPIEDPNQNLGYAVHWYPGWYNTSDSNHDAKTSIRSFQSSVPVVKNYPIMITEVDWSPEDPNGVPHKNEYGQDVIPNCGTWATGSTSKFGEAYKATLEYFDNIGMTLTHTHDYIDIDEYLKSGTLLPAFHDKLSNNAYEACSGACFCWYPVWAKSTHNARVFDESGQTDLFPLDEMSFDPSIWETGSYDEETHCLITGQYGFGGWRFSTGLDLSPWKYLVIKLAQTPESDGWSFRMFDENNYWTSCYQNNFKKNTEIIITLQDCYHTINDKISDKKLDVSHIYIAGFWSYGFTPLYIDKIYATNNDDYSEDTSSIELIIDQEGKLSPASHYNLFGQPVSRNNRGFGISPEGKIILVR